MPRQRPTNFLGDSSKLCVGGFPTQLNEMFFYANLRLSTMVYVVHTSEDDVSVSTSDLLAQRHSPPHRDIRTRLLYALRVEYLYEGCLVKTREVPKHKLDPFFAQGGKPGGKFPGLTRKLQREELSGLALSCATSADRQTRTESGRLAPSIGYTPLPTVQRQGQRS